MTDPSKTPPRTRGGRKPGDRRLRVERPAARYFRYVFGTCKCAARGGIDKAKIMVPMLVGGFFLLGLWTVFPGLVGGWMGSPIRP